ARQDLADLSAHPPIGGTEDHPIAHHHHVIVQNRILRAPPWVALELFDAFRRSKEVAYQRARRYASAYLYFPGADRQEQAEVLGEDPYPLGLRAMAKNVERAIRGSMEQGLLTKQLRLQGIYYPYTLKTSNSG